MIRHIVFWKFREDVREEAMRQVRQRLTALEGVIPELLSMELGEDVLHSDMSWDMALVAAFADIKALDTYKNHPAHQAVSKYVAGVRTHRACVDFEVRG